MLHFVDDESADVFVFAQILLELLYRASALSRLYMDQGRTNVKREQFALGPWKLISTEGSILKSICTQPDICQHRSEKCELCT